ncbi:hypothetical protein L1987_84411 [Smallanthus sonchifolius]|uniref:Uncharacterized protein n=1 Tax=Smallanthus sonchifolius TaxID=185202 RepID=A0ACB8YER0_9ASTR|nr:hypothetical protein L1987_84411 [Smallanthus sonchifolius]
MEENSIIDTDLETKLLPDDHHDQKGVNEAFEKIASYGLQSNMIFYLMEVYQMEAVAGTTVIFIWSALSTGLSIFGAFVSDSYLVGSGCVRPCSLAFGADQLEQHNNQRLIDSYFNWYYATATISTVIGSTVVVYIQDRFGWRVGFAVPVLFMFCSALMFILGSSLYVKVKVNESPYSGFIQVLIMAFKNRRIRLLPHDCYNHSNEMDRVELTHNLRWSFIIPSSCAVFTVSMTVAALVASLLTNIVDSVTGQGGHVSWLSSDIDQGHVDYYYCGSDLQCLKSNPSSQISWAINLLDHLR